MRKCESGGEKLRIAIRERIARSIVGSKMRRFINDFHSYNFSHKISRKIFGGERQQHQQQDEGERKQQ